MLGTVFRSRVELASIAKAPQSDTKGRLDVKIEEKKKRKKKED
jgi:hypothetical protein